ncbi:hypothetical protein BV898_09851 [Hypsibius exemplaris]|uniref:WAP domain-containing protein n=1 Tax=Hypsibius exemplaris TaxID=2072580 RepID=A0A1W0WL45_HYPEX|nr:hypothetical protein BV898_09851 [Hypsibius exemplaris]
MQTALLVAFGVAFVVGLTDAVTSSRPYGQSGSNGAVCKELHNQPKCHLKPARDECQRDSDCGRNKICCKNADGQNCNKGCVDAPAGHPTDRPVTSLYRQDSHNSRDRDSTGRDRDSSRDRDGNSRDSGRFNSQDGRDNSRDREWGTSGRDSSRDRDSGSSRSNTHDSRDRRL